MLKRAPVWLKRPSAAAFGFGGRLVSVVNEKRTLAGGQKVDAAHIEIKQVCHSSDCAFQIVRPMRGRHGSN